MNMPECLECCLHYQPGKTVERTVKKKFSALHFSLNNCLSLCQRCVSFHVSTGQKNAEKGSDWSCVFLLVCWIESSKYHVSFRVSFMCRKWWKQAEKSDTFLTHVKIKKVVSELLTTFFVCPRLDSNQHAELPAPPPQGGASTNFATRANSKPHIKCILVL